jgi:peroxiredoxin
MRAFLSDRPACLLGLTLFLATGGALAQPVPVAAPAPKAPPQKESAQTPPPRLGTLPEGVGLAVGSKVPDARLSDAEGRPVQLSDLVKRGPVLVMFYRGGWCPYCNFQIRSLTQAHGEFQRRGITPVAISVDKIQEAAKTRATYAVPFPVLSDPDLATHRAFRMVHQADDAEVAKLKGYGIDLEASSGRTHHGFAVPGLFLIDRDGTVRWAHADPDYKVRPKTEQILAAIDSAALPPAPAQGAKP